MTKRGMETISRQPRPNNHLSDIFLFQLSIHFAKGPIIRIQKTEKWNCTRPCTNNAMEEKQQALIDRNDTGGQNSLEQLFPYIIYIFEYIANFMEALHSTSKWKKCRESPYAMPLKALSRNDRRGCLSSFEKSKDIKGLKYQDRGS